jgi:hypothetical protein
MPEQARTRHRAVRSILAIGHIPNLRPHLGPFPPGIQSENLGAAAVGALEVHEHLEQGALARAVDAEEEVHRTVGHSQVDLFEGGLPAIPLGQSASGDGVIAD